MPNPYTNLKAEFKKFVAQIDALNATRAFYWEGKDVMANVTLLQIREQAAAANTLGFETLVVVENGWLHFSFRKKIPSTPYIC